MKSRLIAVVNNFPYDDEIAFIGSDNHGFVVLLLFLIYGFF
jgi:hypothetical protein